MIYYLWIPFKVPLRSFLNHRIQLESFKKRSLKMGSKTSYFNLFEDPKKLQTKEGYSNILLKNNLKHRYVPCFELKDLYGLRDMDYYRRGKILARVLRSGLIIICPEDQLFLATIPKNYIWDHLSNFTGLKPAKLESILVKSTLRVLTMMDLPQSQWSLLREMKNVREVL